MVQLNVGNQCRKSTNHVPASFASSSLLAIDPPDLPQTVTPVRRVSGTRTGEGAQPARSGSGGHFRQVEMLDRRTGPRLLAMLRCDT
jgi:hypothetical protein